MSDEMEQVAVSGSGSGSRSHLWPRLALVQAVLLLAAVVVALPVAFRSMGILLTDGQARTLYEFPSGQAATAAATAALEKSESYFNIAAIDLDEDLGSITLAISGHRICPDDGCSTLDAHPHFARGRRRRATGTAAVRADDLDARSGDLQPDDPTAGARAAQPVPVRRLPALARSGRDGGRKRREDSSSHRSSWRNGPSSPRRTSCGTF